MKWPLREDLLITPLLIFLIVFSPLIYGSIPNLPLTIVEGVSFLVLFIFLLTLLSQDRFSLVKIPNLSLYLFIALIILQLLPLPAGLLSFFSPATAALYKDFSFTPLNTLSIYKEAGINMFLQFLSWLAIFFVAINYIDKEQKRKQLILTIIICGFLYSLYGIIRKFSTPLGGFSTFTNRNHFAAYAEMIIPVSIVYSFLEFSNTKKIIYIFLASVTGLGLILSLSRSGIICFSLSLLLSLLLFGLKRKIKRGIGIIAGLLIFLAFFMFLIGSGAVTQRLETLKNPLKALSGRIEVAQDATRIIKDFPFFGTGLGTFIDIFQKYKSFTEARIYRFSHNEPIQLLVETGITGFVCIFLFLIFFIKDIMRIWLRRHQHYAVYLTLGCLVGIFSIIMHSFFEFVFHVPANSLMFFIILALAYRIVYVKDLQDQMPIPKIEFAFKKGQKLIYLTVACLLFISAETVVFKRYKAEAIFYKTRKEKITETGPDAVFEYRKALRCIDRAIAYNAGNSSYLSKKAELLVEAAIRQDLTQEDLIGLEDFHGREEVFSAAEMLCKRAINLNPTKAGYHLQLGQVYSFLKDKPTMESEFEKAIRLDPQNKEIKGYIAKITNTIVK